MAAAPKAAPKTAAAKPAPKAAAAAPKDAGKAAAAKPNALKAPVTPGKDLATLVGSAPLPRTEIVQKLWEHIKKHNLQNPANKREILADAKLKTALGSEKFTMFEMNKLVSNQLQK